MAEETEKLEDIKLFDKQNIDLTTAIDIALKNNFSLLQSFEDNQIYRLRAKKEFTSMLPVFSASTDYKYNTHVRDLKIPQFPQQSRPEIRNEVDTYVTVSQPITELFKLGLNYKVAKENYNISMFDTDLERETVINNVSGYYFDILKQKRTIELNKQNIKALEEYYKVAHDRFETGEALARDYLKIKYEIENARHDLLVAQNKLDILVYQFKDALGINLKEDINIVDNFQEETFINQPLEELQDIAMVNRPDVLQLEANIRVANLNKKIEYTKYIPDIDFYVSYIHLYGAGLSPPNNVIFGVNASYDFWKWNQKYIGVKEQAAEIRKNKLAFKELENQVLIDIETQLNSVKEAKNLIEVSKVNVEVSKESLRITKNRFDVGLALILDLLDDQTNYLDSQVQLVSSELNYQKSLVELKKRLGMLVQR